MRIQVRKIFLLNQLSGLLIAAAMFLLSSPVSACGGGGGTPPVAAFTSSATTICAGGAVTYVNTSTNATSYQWTFTGGTPGTSTLTTPPAISYAVSGSYNATLVASGTGASTATAVITVESPITSAVISASTNVACNGSNTGSATVTATGGLPYAYLWNPGNQTTATITGLSAGTYTANVSNACGALSATVNISEPTALVPGAVATTPAGCGVNNGTASITPSGGTLPYTYSWSPGGQTNATATGLSANTYSVTVTDNNGCLTTVSGNVTSSSGILVTATVNSNTGACTSIGKITANPTGGVPPYTYSWSPSGITTATASGLSGGCYTVIVQDNNNCSAVNNACITQPTPLTVTLGAHSNVSCSGVADGSATVNASSGSLPYTYLWNPGGQTTPTVNGLSAGTYTATVHDNSSCSGLVTVTIGQPALLTATMSLPINIECFGDNNGSATVTAGGGSSPYSYLWTPGNQTNATATGLSAGTYTATVSIGTSSCSAITTVNISEPPLLTANISATTYPVCNGNSNGSATVTAGGGVAPYTYLWTNGQTNNSIAGLSANTYTITVTDNNNCTASTSVDITQPGVLSTTLTPTNIICFGNTNGVITPTTTGGTAAYNYNWSNGQVTTNATGLTAGTYSVSITDAHGCITNGSTSVASPTLLTISANGPSSACWGVPVTFNSIAAGGTTPYTYDWTPTGGNAASANINPTVTTTYSITVTDNSGCTAIATMPLTVSAPLTVNIGGVTAICPGETANMDAIASGGDGQYQYVWTPGNQHSRTASYVVDNNIDLTVQVTDGCGSPTVTANASIVINPLPAINFSADIMNGCVPLCVQFRDLSTIASGNLSTQAWAFGTGDSAYTTTPIYCYKNSGMFSVKLTATSDSGCSSTKIISDMIDVYPSPIASFSYSPEPLNITNPEVQFIDQSTGQSPITQWYWRFGQGDSISSLRNPTHYYPDTGNYCPTLTVIDSHGCIDSITSCFVVNPQFSFYIPNAFTPNGDDINDVFIPKGTYVKGFEMYIFSRWGTQLFHTTDINTGWNGNINNGSQACGEDTYIYMINVTDSRNNTHSYTGKVILIR